MIRLATPEEVARFEDNGRLVETFWRLKYRSSRVRVRVYRLIEKDEYGLGLVTIYENIERKLFVGGAYHSGSDQFVPEERELADLSDAWNVVNHLWYLVLVTSERWDSEGADSIDGAADKFSLERRERFERARSFCGTHSEAITSAEEIDRASAEEAERDEAEVDDVEADEGEADEVGTDEMEHRDYLRNALDQLRNRLRKIAGTTDVYWKPLEPTLAGRECQIFVMDGKEEHWAPLRLFNLWPGRGRPARLSDRYL